MTRHSRKVRSSNAAHELSDWFASVSALTSEAFDMGKEPRGRAAVLHVLRQQSSRLLSSPLDREGKAYLPLSLFLVSACKALEVRLQAAHWEAALHNVERQEAIPTNVALGLELGTPAHRFKELLDDALDGAGLGRRESVLDEENRRLALGLAVNWALRVLLAYAAEVKPPHHGLVAGRKDLAWMGGLVRQECEGAGTAT